MEYLVQLSLQLKQLCFESLHLLFYRMDGLPPLNSLDVEDVLLLLQLGVPGLQLAYFTVSLGQECLLLGQKTVYLYKLLLLGLGLSAKVLNLLVQLKDLLVLVIVRSSREIELCLQGLVLGSQSVQGLFGAGFLLIVLANKFLDLLLVLLVDFLQC